MKRPLAILAIVGFTLGAFLGAGCRPDLGERPDEVPEATVLEEIRVGAPVSFSGEVTKVYENGAFRLNPDLGADKEPILVVLPEDQAPKELSADAKVRVVAKVFRMTPVSIRQKYGLNRRIYAKDFDSKNPIVATASEIQPVDPSQRDEEKRGIF